MNVKEIAQSTGKEVRAIQNWIKQICAKNAQVFAKNAQAFATKKPAEYTLDEVCQIIEEGMGQDVANVFRTNAVHAEVRTQSKPSLKLPSATQMKVLENLYGAEGARNRIDFAMGYKEEPQIKNGQLAISNTITNTAILSKSAYAVQKKEEEKQRVKQETDRLSNELFTRFKK